MVPNILSTYRQYVAVESWVCKSGFFIFLPSSMAFLFPLEEMVLIFVKLAASANLSAVNIAAGWFVLVRSCPAHCRLFGSVPGLCLQEAHIPLHLHLGNCAFLHTLSDTSGAVSLRMRSTGLNCCMLLMSCKKFFKSCFLFGPFVFQVFEMTGKDEGK